MPNGRLYLHGGLPARGRVRMNNIILLLFGFMLLGLFSPRLGKSTYLILSVLVVGYVFYAYITF